MKCDAECFCKANSRWQYEFGSRCMASRVREEAMIPRTVASCRVTSRVRTCNPWLLQEKKSFTWVVLLRQVRHRSTITHGLIQLNSMAMVNVRSTVRGKDTEKPRLLSSAGHTAHVHSEQLNHEGLPRVPAIVGWTFSLSKTAEQNYWMVLLPTHSFTSLLFVILAGNSVMQQRISDTANVRGLKLMRGGM